MEMELNLLNGYHTACKKSFEELKNRNFEEISLNSNASYSNESNVFRLKYLNNDYEVNCSTGYTRMLNCDDEVTDTVKIMLLHYLLNAKNKPLSGKLISFKELREGAAIYYQTFYKRAIAPLIKTFGDKPDLLHKAASMLDGIKESFGHSSVTIKVLPLVPVTYVVWEGNEEASASGTILFDDSIESFLPAEDIVFAASFGTYELMKLSK